MITDASLKRTDCPTTGREKSDCHWCKKEVNHFIDTQDFDADQYRGIDWDETLSCEWTEASWVENGLSEGMRSFLHRGRTFKRHKIVARKHELDIYTDTIQQGYAWIGLAHHNRTNGNQAVDCLNYMLIQPEFITVYFVSDIDMYQRWYYDKAMKEYVAYKALQKVVKVWDINTGLIGKE